MKNQKFTKRLMLLIMVSAIFAGCTKEGPQGPDGQDGIDGQDGTAGCIKCHDNSQVIEAKSVQWESSIHAIGGNFERNSTSCAPCHTSQGFLEVLETGGMETAASISNPLPVNCYTCHNIHDTYTEEDWTLTASEPVTLWTNGFVTDQGVANLCVNCHQPRVVDPFPDKDNLDGNYDITSPYFGPHHSTQGAMIAATGGFEVGNGYEYDHPHGSVENSCKTCHMAEAYGNQAGGHNMGMSYEYHGQMELNVAGCTNCHDEDIAEEVEEENATFDALLTELKDLLIAEGVYDPETGRAVPGTYTNRLAGAYYNYMFVEEDQSLGLHNYDYAKKLIENTIASLNEQNFAAN